jgi:transcriptional regulator with XRE-family HTH domain
MNEQHLPIGQLMKAARKFKKFNQSDVAHAMGCSQSALSKMEHNLLMPNAPQWFLFSRYTSIPPESIETGIIDRNSTVKLNNDNVSIGFKLPKRYRSNRSMKVREIYPLYSFLKKTNKEDFELFSKSLGIDHEFFLDFDNLVNFQLFVDLVNFFIGLKKTSLRDIQEVVRFGQDNFYWDHFKLDSKQVYEAKDVLVKYAKEQVFFQVDFKIIIESDKELVFVSYVPESHLTQFLKDISPETKVWLGHYRKLSLENLIKHTLGVEIDVRSLPSLSNLPLEDRFEIH